MVGRGSLKTKLNWTVLIMAGLGLALILPFSVSALSEEDYSKNSIYFYNPDGNKCTVGSVATALEGDSNAVKIWNWFVNAGIPGVSDNAAVIAGILGNLEQESRYNPLARGGGWGLFQVTGGSGRLTDYKNYLASKGVPESAFGTQNANLNDVAITATLEFLVNEWGSWSQFLNGLSSVTGTGNEAVTGYAELFLITVENAFGASATGIREPLQNLGVISYAQSLGKSIGAWQERGNRVEYAIGAYTTYGQSGSAPSSDSGTAPSAGSNMVSSGICESSGITANGNGATLATYNNVKIAFPIANATKDTVSGGRGAYTYLSNIPCNHPIGCHYGEGIPAGYAAAAFDVCLNGATSSSRCVGSTVVSMMSGTVTRTIATTRNGAFCNHVRIRSDYDNKTIAYMHLEGDQALSDSLPAGTHIEAGTVIGHVSGNSPCHDNSTPHVHIDMNATPGAGGALRNERDPLLVPMMNVAYAALPENEAELSAREAASGNVDEGGLTYEQAIHFMINYGANKNGSSSLAATSGLWNMCNGGGSNCVTFSAFFLNKFTNTYVGSRPGNGYQVVGNLAGKGVSTGKTPKVWSVFSWSAGEYGHTGVILGYQNGEWIVGHASCSREKRGAGDGTKGGSGSGFVLKSASLKTALLGNDNATYAYLENQVNIEAISNYLVNGV